MNNLREATKARYGQLENPRQQITLLSPLIHTINNLAI